MREHKFRVVNKKSNEIVGYEWLEDEGWKHSLPEKGIISHGVFHGPRVNKRFIRVQFTGLLDKLGKEIFEGDVVFYEGIKEFKEDDIVSPVKWGKWCYVIKNHKAFDIITARSFEIIGNIYENPELLEVSTKPMCPKCGGVRINKGRKGYTCSMCKHWWPPS